MKFNNPFIWMICPYDSIIYIMNNFDKIDWFNYEFEKSKLKENTFIIKVENNIEIHYVHYKFDPNANSIIQEKKNLIKKNNGLVMSFIVKFGNL